MGTEDVSETMLAQDDTGGQAHIATVAAEPPSVGDGAVPPVLPTPVTDMVKAKETFRRPPLPSSSLYDAYLLNKAATQPRRRVAPVDTPPPPVVVPEPPRQETPVTRSDILSVSCIDAVAALETWSETANPRRPGRASH